MFGHRARIGYTAPLLSVEVFPYEFYRIVPEGVTLILTTAAQLDGSGGGARMNSAMVGAAVREMAQAGANVIVVGGATPGLSMGADRLDEFTRGLEGECGVPVTTALTAQLHALHAVGAKRLAISPQCGFSSGVGAGPSKMREEEQWRKLERVVEVARQVWG